MKTKKILKKYGNSLVITFTKEEISLHKLEEGMEVDISDIVFKEVEINKGGYE